MKYSLVLALLCLLVLASTGYQVVTGNNHTLGPGETVSGDLLVFGGDSTLAQNSHINNRQSLAWTRPAQLRRATRTF